MSLITRNPKVSKYDCTINVTNLPERSFGDVLSLRHPNHFVLASANNRNVIITYRFLAAPVQANRDFFYIDELLECLLGISPSGRNPCGGNYANVSTINQSKSLPGFWVVSDVTGQH